MKKMLLFDTWNIEELESWFSYMAEQGWHLVEIKRGRAFFEKGKGEKVRYRIDTFQINELKGQNKIHENEHLGWQYVDSIGYIHIFREKEFVEAKEIYTDPLKHAQSLTVLIRSHLLKTVGVTFFTGILLWLQLKMLKNNTVNIFLDNIVLLQIVLFLFLFYIVLKMYHGVFYLSRLSSKLKSGYQFQRNTVTKIKFNKLRLKSFLMITLGVFIPVMGFMDLLFYGSYKPIPEEEISVVKLSDILEGENYEDVRYSQNGGQFYKEGSSFLVPRQYELRQSAEIAKDNLYKPSIWAERYEVRTESIANAFVFTFVKERQYHGVYERKSHPNLDELWTIEQDDFTSFIARDGKDVYVVDYWGIEPIDTLLQYSVDF